MKIRVKGRMLREQELKQCLISLIESLIDDMNEKYDIDENLELYVGNLNITFDLFDSTGELIEFEGYTSKDIFAEIKIPNKKRTKIPRKKDQKPNLKVVNKK